MAIQDLDEPVNDLKRQQFVIGGRDPADEE